MLSMDPNICFFALRNRIELQCLIIIFSHFYIIIIIIIISIITNKYHYHSPQPSKIISRKQTPRGRFRTFLINGQYRCKGKMAALFFSVCLLCNCRSDNVVIQTLA